jgi:hypothetical protein
VCAGAGARVCVNIYKYITTAKCMTVDPSSDSDSAATFQQKYKGRGSAAILSRLVAVAYSGATFPKLKTLYINLGLRASELIADNFSER